jgi:hypothetical protein
MSLTLEQRVELLENQINEFYKYIPYVYTQKTTDADGVYNVDIPLVRQIPDQLLYLVAVKRSINGSNKLVVKQGNTTITMDIFYEDNRGTLNPISVNAISASKLCIFRLQRFINRAILVNATIEDTAIVRDMTVSNNLNLYSKPRIVDSEGEEIDEIVTLSQLTIRLNQDIPAKIQDYIIVGTESEGDALADAPDGAVYFKVGEDV